MLTRLNIGYIILILTKTVSWNHRESFLVSVGVLYDCNVVHEMAVSRSSFDRACEGEGSPAMIEGARYQRLE